MKRLLFFLLSVPIVVHSQSVKDRLDDIEFQLLLEKLDREKNSSSPLNIPIPKSIPYVWGKDNNGVTYSVDGDTVVRQLNKRFVYFVERKTSDKLLKIDGDIYNYVDTSIEIDCKENLIRFFDEKYYFYDKLLVRTILVKTVKNKVKYSKIDSNNLLIYTKYRDAYCP